MQCIKGDIWAFHPEECVCIPTNGFLTKAGSGVMGAGLALQAKTKYPEAPAALGLLLKEIGNRVGWILKDAKLISVPVKPCFLDLNTEEDLSEVLPRVRNLYKLGSRCPGFHCRASLDLIRSSLQELLEFLSQEKLTRAYLPLLGCGNGDLDPKKDLYPILSQLKLPDSIILVIPTFRRNL